MTKRKSIGSLMGLGILLPVTVGAGIVYEIEVTDHGQSPPRAESSEVAVEGRNLKMDVASKGREERGEMIYRGERREIVVVDHDDKSYHVMDEETMRQLGDQANAMRAQMQETLKNIPADQRAMVEQAMKQRLPQRTPPKLLRSELRKTDERGKKNGYPCVKYEVWTGPKKTRELWVTDWDNVEGGEDVIGVFEDLADFFRELMDALPDMGQGGSGAGANPFEHIKELGGFPVVTREFDEDGSLDSESMLRSTRRRQLDPSEFEPPSGYKRRQMSR